MITVSYNKISPRLLFVFNSGRVFILTLILAASIGSRSSESSSGRGHFETQTGNETLPFESQAGTSTKAPFKYSKLNIANKDVPLNQTTQSRQMRYEQDGDTRVPFWNIAHMINSIQQIEPALQ